LAFIFRWDNEPQKTYNNDIVAYQNDRWTGQDWVKSYSQESIEERPIIPFKRPESPYYPSFYNWYAKGSAQYYEAERKHQIKINKYNSDLEKYKVDLAQYFKKASQYIKIQFAIRNILTILWLFLVIIVLGWINSC